MLEKLSALAIRWRFAFIAFWLIVAAGLFLCAPRLADVAAYSSQGFLPDSSPSKKAETMLAAITQPKNGQTSLVITLSRPTGLTAEDEVAGRALADYFGTNGTDLRVKSIQHPWQGQEYRDQLWSKNNQTALIVLNLDEHAYSGRVKAIVENLRAKLGVSISGHRESAAAKASGFSIPAGLEIHVTGEAAFSYDEHALVNQSMDLITQITVGVVLLVLILVFRSPVTPLIPLSVIGLSFLISRSIVALLSLVGFTVSAYTETFMVAVLFGAGTDYCLLIVSRYREELRKGRDPAEALRLTQRWSGPAIISSGGTVVVGFLCMGLAGFGLYNTTGPSVAIGVVIAILMVLTLTPAALSLLRPIVFWPGPANGHSWKPGKTASGRLGAILASEQALSERSPFWDRLAVAITRRPVRILIAVGIILVPFMVASIWSTRSFDMLSELPTAADSIQGFNKISTDFEIGESMPLKILVQSPKNLWNNKSLQVLEKVSLSLLAEPGVSKVRTATRPTGQRIDQVNAAEKDPSKPFNLPKLVIAANPQLKDAMSLYMTEDGKQAYFDVVLVDSPYRHEALDKVEQLRAKVKQELAGSWIDGAKVEIGGATAMFSDVREITAADFNKVMVFVLAGIFLVLVILLRSLVAPFYLLLTIVASYAVTMGITGLVFMGILGYEGINWAVPFFAFCVLVALGVDYNIFLMTRVLEEYKPGFNTRAVALAMGHTGKIITSCGIIMAGCFSAMMVSPVRSIVEVGFATVLGLLIDTFIIRTLVVPALATVIGEWNWWPRFGKRK